MFYVYVLKSESDAQLYIDLTNDLKRRLLEHNAGKSRATKKRTPFALVYYEAYADWKDAHEREARLKLRGQARHHLKKRITRSLQQES